MKSRKCQRTIRCVIVQLRGLLSVRPDASRTTAADVTARCKIVVPLLLRYHCSRRGRRRWCCRSLLALENEKCLKKRKWHVCCEKSCKQWFLSNILFIHNSPLLQWLKMHIYSTTFSIFIDIFICSKGFRTLENSPRTIPFLKF